MRSATLQGLLLFLVIPLVLFLFLREPLGPGLSVALGLVVMFGHRFAAAPWARRHASTRCAWCSGGTAAGVALEVGAGGRPWQLRACSEHHASCTARFLSATRRARVPIAVGIFLPLLVLLAASLARAAGWPVLSHDVAALQFRVVVAVTVVAASIGYALIRQPDESLVSPFPLHNLLLLGIRQTLWIFRLVGTWWIVAGIGSLV